MPEVMEGDTEMPEVMEQTAPAPAPAAPRVAPTAFTLQEHLNAYMGRRPGEFVVAKKVGDKYRVNLYATTGYIRYSRFLKIVESPEGMAIQDLTIDGQNFQKDKV